MTKSTIDVLAELAVGVVTGICLFIVVMIIYFVI